MSVLNQSQQVTADSTGAFSASFGPPGLSFTWTAQLTATSPEALSGVSFMASVSGQDIGTWYGPLPFGPLQARNSQRITVLGAGAAAGQVITINLLGSADSGNVPALGPAPQGALPPPVIVPPNQELLASGPTLAGQTTMQVSIPSVPLDITGIEVVMNPQSALEAAVLYVDGSVQAASLSSPALLPNLSSALRIDPALEIELVTNTPWSGTERYSIIGMRGSLGTQLIPMGGFPVTPTGPGGSFPLIAAPTLSVPNTEVGILGGSIVIYSLRAMVSALGGSSSINVTLGQAGAAATFAMNPYLDPDGNPVPDQWSPPLGIASPSGLSAMLTGSGDVQLAVVYCLA